MQTFLRNNNSDELILFFNGWGMDEKPFNLLKSNRDILFVSDYTDLNNDFLIDYDFKNYKKIILICFSAGVFMASYLQDKLPKVDLKIAVNGTLPILDEQKGIPKEIFFQMENISLANALDFRKKLVDNKKHYNLFNKYQPHRDLESSLNEIYALKKYFAHNTFLDYDKVIIGENDEIIPCLNQQMAWIGHKNIRKMSGGHFLFYNFYNFDEIIEI